MSEESNEPEYVFKALDEDVKERPKCAACGDPVKIVMHSGGKPMAAQHCRECYAELRNGKIPKYNQRRKRL